jgi:phytoene dehydrogenase-like protein
MKELGVRVQTGRRVTDVVIENNRATAVKTADEVYDADAVVFAVGINGMKNIVRQSAGTL